jgi:hypothetical protein
MKRIWIGLLACTIFIPLYATEHNTTKEHNMSKESNQTVESDKTKEAVKKAMELEEKYAKEQRFYQGDEYDLKSKEIDPETLKKVPAIEPDYDFNMDTGVYDD